MMIMIIEIKTLMIKIIALTGATYRPGVLTKKIFVKSLTLYTCNI